MSSAIQQDAPIETTDLGEDATVDAFLDLWKKGAEKPPGNENEEDEPESDEEDPEDNEEPGDDQETEETEEDDESEEDPDEDDEEPEEDEEKPRKVLKDDAVTRFKVDGKDVEVPVAKLQRLYGQEAALTRKSQEVAETRKKLEDQGATYVAASETMLKRAQDRYKPYTEIDWLMAAKDLNSEELQALRGEAQKAYQDVQFYEKELGSFMDSVHQQRRTVLVAEAQQTLKNLQDPKTGIKGFNQQTYEDMRSFAINHGVPKETMDNLVSEPILRMLHKAMLFEKGSKVVTKPKDLKAKKIIKGKVNSDTSRSGFTTKKTTKALENLKKTGSQDAATEAFLASFMDD